MAYSFSGRVRYSEIGENGLLTLPGILNYFQDCSTFQSEEVGLGIDILKEWKRIWVLSAWQVVVDRYPYMGERIKTSTWAYGFRGFMGLRNFTMETEGGERLAYANTFWTYIDAENGLPVRLEAKDTDAYRGKDGKMESKLDMEYAPRKIVLPEDYEQQDSFAVQKHHLDTNHHVNNCQYVQMAMDYLPENFKIHQMRAEYKQQARLNDVICPARAVDENTKHQVLLPTKQVPAGTKAGDKLEVFIYKDSQDRLIATTNEPLLMVGQAGLLKVKQVTRIGAFLDWGLEKDLLLPYHEQTTRIFEGQECLVAVYVDKSSRLCATMKVYPYLSKETPYKEGDQVKGRVYQISENFGVFVAVDNKYSALIPAREAKGKYRPGTVLDLRVTRVKEDGKMDVSDRQEAYLQINEDAENVLEIIEEFAGVLPFDDKASPEVIRREFGLSKNAFKRAVGHLLKEGKIQIKDRRIYLVK